MNVPKWMRQEIAQDMKRGKHLALMAKEQAAKEARCQKKP